MCGKKFLIKFGDVVTSLMGHDIGRKYLVISEIDENFVLVCDGKYRKLENPKQKRKKHLKPEFNSKIDSVEGLSDSDIRKIINY